MSTQVMSEPPQPQATAVMTQVDIDLVDAAGARWAGAKVQVTFVAPPHVAGPYLWNGATFQQYYYIENVGSSGHFTISLPSNLDITPFGYLSYWRFDIVPNIDDGRNAVITVQVSTTAMDLSSSFVYATQSLIRDLVQSFPVPRSSMDQWVASVTNDGQIYFDSTMQVLKIWANGGWQVATAGGGGGGISYPPSGIAVSQGTAWGASLDPNNSYLKLTGGTMTGDLTLNTYLNVSGPPGTSGIFYTQGNDDYYVTSTPPWGFSLIQDAINFVVSPGAVDGAATIYVTKWYTGSEIITNLTGDPLYSKRTTIVDQRVAPWTFYSFNGTNWVVASSGGGGATYPPAGIPVSTGSAWGNSLDPNNSYLPLTGGTLSGSLYFSDPYDYIVGSAHQLYIRFDIGLNIQDYNANTYFYINSSSVTSTVPVYLPADPTTPLQAATKQYVDNNLPKVIQVADEATAISDSTANPQNFYFWV